MDETNALQLLRAANAEAQTAQSIGADISVGPKVTGLQRPATFEERNQKPGLPIDLKEGAPALVKFNVGLRDDPAQKLEYLEGIYGKGAARLADDGTPLIRIVGSDNKPKEIPVNEQGITFSDAASLASFLPDIAGAALAIRGGRAVAPMGGSGAGRAARLLQFGRDVAAEGIGQEAGGALRDIATGVNDRGAANLQEIAERRAKNVPMDMTAAAIMGGIGKVAGKAITPVRQVAGEVQQDLLAARDYFKQRFGLEFPLTAGEATGSSLLKRTEATMEKLPGASSAMGDVRQEKLQRFRQIMNRMMGLTDEATPETRFGLPTEEDVGKQAISAIRSKADPVLAAEEAARNNLSREITATVGQEVADATGSAVGLAPEKIGQTIRTRIFELRDAFRNESRSLYEATYALPGGSDRVFTPKTLPKAASDVLKALPPKDVVEEINTGVLDAYGQPILKTVKGTVPNKEFVPAGVVDKLKNLAGIGDTKLSLKDLVAMRTDVDSAIAQGEAIPGVSTHYLSKIRGMLTSQIDESVSSLPDGQLKASWQAANKHYAENVGTFTQGPVARLFKDIESRGFVQDEDIVKKIGPTEYQTFKTTLGENSAEFKLLKRGILDEVVAASTPFNSGVIDGGAFITQLNNFYRSNRTVAEDVLGAKGQYLARLGELQKAATGEGALIDPAKFRDLLARGDSVNKALDTVLGEQKKLTSLYQSKIVKDIAERRLGDSFDAGEFVQRFYNKASPEELKQVVVQLQDNPEVLQNLRQKVIDKMFFDAQKAIAETDPSALGRGEMSRPASADRLDKIFGDADQKERLQIILGNQTYRDFEQFGKLVRSGDVSEKAFAGAGGLTAGMQVSQMIHGGVFSYMADWAKQKVASIMLTLPVARQWLGNTVMTPAQQSALTRGFIMSTPFLEAVNREFGNKDGDFVDTLMGSISRYDQLGPRKSGPTETAEQRESRMKDLLRSQEQKVFPIPPGK